MADVPKLVEELWSLTLLEAIELAEILKKKWRPPEVSLADIKRYLPHWPDAVIELWLFYLANRSAGDTGWPPPEPLGNHFHEPYLQKALSWLCKSLPGYEGHCGADIDGESKRHH